MYKSDLADHPWRKLRDRAVYARTYQHIGRDLKIGQLWILLALFIVVATTLTGAYLSTMLYQPFLQGEVGKFLAKLNYQRSLIICALTIIQCTFVFIGSKVMLRLLTLQLVPLALLALGGAAYLLSMPETRSMGLLVLIGFSPYILCAGILTLSWRAKLYLAYMHGK